jgi:hypothetical protein
VVRWSLIIALVAGAVAIGGHAAAQPQAQASRSHPRLSLAQRSPLKVRGAGFRRHERVRVVARAGAGAPSTRHVKAGRSGTFVVSFPGRPAARCGLLLVRATGSRGSRAAVGVRSPECNVH